MQKYKIGRWVALIIVIALLIGGGLWGSKYYKQWSEERKGYELVVAYDETNRSCMEAYGDLMFEDKSEEEQQKLLEDEDYIEELMEMEDDRNEALSKMRKHFDKYGCSAKLLQRILEEDEFIDNTKEAVLQLGLETCEGDKIEAYYPILDSPKVEEMWKPTILAYLVPQTGEQKKEIRNYIWERLEQETEAGIFCSLMKLFEVFDNPQKYIEEAVEYYMNEEHKVSEGQRAGAVMAKVTYLGESATTDWSKEENNEVSKVLRNEFHENLACGNQEQAEAVLEAIYGLKRPEDVAWILEMIEDKLAGNVSDNYEVTNQEGLSTEEITSSAYNPDSDRKRVHMFYPGIVSMALDLVKTDPSLENVSNLIRVLNCASEAEIMLEHFMDMEAVYLLLEKVTEEHLQKEQLPELLVITDGRR